MIVLTVLSYNGAPADGLSASFDELGGTIGRADNNQLVLPDPERTISRVHARVVFRTTGYTVVDNGSNPISVNGTPLGTGREHPLKPGDQIQIGGYVLQAAEGRAAAAAADDPFADLFGDAHGGLAAPPPVRAPAPAWPAPPPTVAAPRPAAAQPAPAWPAPAPPASPASPAWSSPAPAWPAPPARPAAPASGGHIPDDWDPFAPDAPAPAAPAPMAGGGLDLQLGGTGGDSLDDLFGLGHAAPAADPFGASPQQVLLQPNTAAHADPLAALGRGPFAAPAASVSDHGSELNAPMLLTPAQGPAPAPPGTPAGAVFSWNEVSRDGRVITLPGVRRTDAEPVAPLPAPRSMAGAPARAPSASGDALLAALLEGLATPALRIDALTPELMRLVGELLRESMRGAVELLVARAALKREMRADVTMIVAQENNPLKFAPSVEVALQHLLGAPSPGFMAAAPAVRDAFDDLRAHQLGVMAGMKAALEGVLQRFDPQQLEAKLTRKSAVLSLIPSSRKARLWELFQELFSQISSEAQDDFDELFGKAFLRAYQTQLDLLQREPGPR